MLYLTTAWETPDPQGDPTVLYCGDNASKATDAVINAPANFLRVERADIHFSISQSLPAVRPPALAKEPGGPTIKEGLAMIAEIERLNARNEEQNALADAAAQQGRQMAESNLDFARQLRERDELIQRLRLPADAIPPTTTTQVASPSPEAAAQPSSSAATETPAAGSEPAAASGEADSADAGPSLGPTRRRVAK